MAILFSIFLGTLAVLQSGLNRKVGQEVGLSAALVLNSLVLVCLAIGFFVAQNNGLPVHEAMRSPQFVGLRRWWFLIPGLCGFVIIVGFPFAIDFLGASRVFVLAVSAQLIASLLWDLFVEEKTLGWTRVAGVLLAIAGAALTQWNRSSP